MNREDKIKLAISKGITCNPETGEVFGIRGNIIKNISSDGYNIISIREDRKIIQIKSHQFIWYIINREVVECIDHINMDKLDNRIINLRNISKQKNHFNTDAKGYCFNKNKNKFISYIKVNYKNIHLGYFNTEDEAKQAYLNAKKIYHII